MKASIWAIMGIDFRLQDALDDATNFQYHLNIGDVEVQNGVIYHKTEYRKQRNHFANFPQPRLPEAAKSGTREYKPRCESGTAVIRITLELEKPVKSSI
jgi:hypothetical protein